MFGLDKNSAQTNQPTSTEIFQQGIISLLDFIAPSSLEFSSQHFQLDTKFARTYYILGYPREVYTGWLNGFITLPEVFDIAMYIYPVDSEVVLKNLRKKVAEFEASVDIDQQRGKVRDVARQAQIMDAENMRDKLQLGEEKFFRLGFYYTVYAEDKEDLEIVSKRAENILRQQLVYSKPATSQQEEAFNSTLPHHLDKLAIRRNMSTGAIATTFPFTSADLTQENGILYGINMHNSGLVIFDRFSLTNSNSVVLSQTGAGKSFAVKLEALRLLMLGVEIMIIDPENEYQKMTEAVGGTYLNLSLNSPSRINPFDLPKVVDNDEEGQENALRNNLIVLNGLLRLMLAGSQAQAAGSAGKSVSPLTPAEEADLDSALIETYAKVGITADPLTHGSTPPTILDLYDTLLHMGNLGPKLAQRLKKYTTGTFAGIFSEQSNLNINNQIVVFNVRDLEDEIRPVAMYVVLNYIWNKTKVDPRRRILIVDEAWQIMKYEDSANFMFGLTKRARKYNLGITNITQDVEDFTSSRFGRAIVANSSMQILLKQSPTAVDLLEDIFKLTKEEKKLLTSFPVGHALFFGGANHVHVQIMASPTEQSLITTDPDELSHLKKPGKAEDNTKPEDAKLADLIEESDKTPDQQA